RGCAARSSDHATLRAGSRGLVRRNCAMVGDQRGITTCIGLAWSLVATTPGRSTALPIYVGLALFSTLFVTKDEAVHAQRCSPGERWLHALLFVLHPIVLAAFAYLWWIGMVRLLVGQLGITIAFLAYQVIYWSTERATACGEPESGRDAWYADLGSRWYV